MEILHTNECSKRIAEAEEISSIALGLMIGCPRCRLNNAAPKLLEACKEALRALRIVYDNTDDDDILAGLDCWPLSELRTAIEAAEKG